MKKHIFVLFISASCLICLDLALANGVVFDTSYYIFDTHLHVIGEGIVSDFKDIPVCIRATDYCDLYYSHASNLDYISQNLLNPEKNSNIRRALMVGGSHARRPGYNDFYKDHLEEDHCEYPEEFYEFKVNKWRGIEPEEKCYPPDDRKAVVALDDKELNNNIRRYFPSMIGFSIDRCNSKTNALNLYHSLYENGEARWIGEILGNDCFFYSLGTKKLSENDDCTTTPDRKMRNLFDMAMDLGVTISFHMPYMSAEEWDKYVNPGTYNYVLPPQPEGKTTENKPEYTCFPEGASNTDAFIDNPCDRKCTQFMSILDATHPNSNLSSNACYVNTLMNMGSANLINFDSYEVITNAYSHLFNTYPGFHVELFRVHKLSDFFSGADPYDPAFVEATYINPDGGHIKTELLDLFLQHADRFTLCSHIYPKWDFSPDDRFGPVENQEWGSKIDMNISDVHSCVGIQNNFLLAVGADADGKGRLIRFNGCLWEAVSDLPGDAPPLYAAAFTDKHENGLNIFIGGFDENHSKIYRGTKNNGQLQFNELASDGKNPKDISIVTYVKKDGNGGDKHHLHVFYAGKGGKIGRFHEVLVKENGTWQTDELEPDTFTEYDLSAWASSFEGIWCDYDSSTGEWEGYAVGYKINTVYPNQPEITGVVMKLSDSGLTWQPYQPEFFADFVLRAIDGQKSHVFIVGDNGSIFEKPNDHNNFQENEHTLTDSDLLSVHYANPNDVFAAGKNGDILRYDQRDEENPDTFGGWRKMVNPTTDVELLRSIHSSGSGPGAGKDAGRNVFAVGKKTSGEAIVQYYEGGNRYWDDWHLYWDTFFSILRQYANTKGAPSAEYPWGGDQAVQMISHCNAERLSGQEPSLTFTCNPDCIHQVIDELIIVEPDTVLDFTGHQVTILENAGFVVESGNLTLITDCNFHMNQGSIISVSGQGNQSSGSITIEVGGNFIMLGELSANSGHVLTNTGLPPSEGTITINAHRFVMGSESKIIAAGFAPNSSGGRIEIMANTMTSWGIISADTYGNGLVGGHPKGGIVNITIEQGNFNNLGSISASVINGAGGKGGSLSISVSGELLNAGRLVADTYGLYDHDIGVPEAGNIFLYSGLKHTNSGVIRTMNVQGDNGKGGYIDVFSEIGDIENSGEVSADAYGLQIGEDNPCGGTIVMNTLGTLTMTGDISADSKSWSNPEGEGTIDLYYGDYMD